MITTLVYTTLTTQVQIHLNICKSHKTLTYVYVAMTSNQTSCLKLIYRLSVSNDYDCILAMLLGSSKNGRLEVTRFSVLTTFGTVSVIRRDAKRNTSGLTAPGSLNTCPMCEGQRSPRHYCGTPCLQV